MTLSEKLSQYTGTQSYTSLKPFSHLVITDGVKALAEVAQWAVLDTAINITHEPHLKSEDFLSIDIESKNGQADIIIGDGNGNVLHDHHYPFTDLEEGQYKLFATGGVLLLASEY